MEVTKRKYTRSTPDQRKAKLESRLATLKAAHEVREKLIAKLELKLHTNI